MMHEHAGKRHDAGPKIVSRRWRPYTSLRAENAVIIKMHARESWPRRPTANGKNQPKRPISEMSQDEIECSGLLAGRMGYRNFDKDNDAP